MNNSKQWNSATPGYLLFVVDQSGSMEEEFIEGTSKAEYTASVINNMIEELIDSCMAGEQIKDRVYISIIGYGGSGGTSVENLRSDYLSDFADKPIRLELVKEKYPGSNGTVVEVDVEKPIYVEPIAQGLTPMGDALNMANKLISVWIERKPECPAPVVINVTDGMPFEGPDVHDEPLKSINAANAIMAMHTLDGSPLVFNVHIGDAKKKVRFPEAESALISEEAKLLFKLSSKVPASYRKAATKFGFDLNEDSRGFVSNADPDTLVNFINFGTSGAVNVK